MKGQNVNEPTVEQEGLCVRAIEGRVLLALVNDDMEAAREAIDSACPCRHVDLILAVGQWAAIFLTKSEGGTDAAAEWAAGLVDDILADHCSDDPEQQHEECTLVDQ
jgi:hypothetical protein